LEIVLINTRDIRGGAARAAYRLHRSLNRIGESCWMLVKEKASTDDSVFRVNVNDSARNVVDRRYILCEAIQEYYIDSHRTDLSNTIFSFAYPGYDLSLLPFVKTADVINLHWVARYQSPLTLHKLLAVGKPVVWTLHDQWAFTGGCHYTGGCKGYLEDCSDCQQLADDPFHLPKAVLDDKLALLHAANLTIVTPSRWLAACARESKVFNGLRIEVIPYSLETDVFIPIAKAEARKALNLPNEAIILLFGVENAKEKRKGFLKLKGAIQQCLKDRKFMELVDRQKIRMVFFGHPSDEFKKIGIPMNALGFLDSDEKLRCAYSAADMFILPSLEDNMPYSMLESMSCGTPVVAFDVGGMPDVITDGVSGKLAAPGDVNGMSEAILSLIHNPDERKEMGANCRRKMSKDFSANIEARRYKDLYGELTKKPVQSSGIMEKVPVATVNKKEYPEAFSRNGNLTVTVDNMFGLHFRHILEQVLLKVFEDGVQSWRRKLEIIRADLKRKERELEQQSEQILMHNKRIGDLMRENRRLSLQLGEVRNSISWKITMPLRRVSIAIKRFGRLVTPPSRPRNKGK